MRRFLIAAAVAALSLPTLGAAANAQDRFEHGDHRFERRDGRFERHDERFERRGGRDVDLDFYLGPPVVYAPPPPIVYAPPPTYYYAPPPPPVASAPQPLPDVGARERRA